jgi:hypothetical protein
MIWARVTMRTAWNGSNEERKGVWRRCVYATKVFVSPVTWGAANNME